MTCNPADLSINTDHSAETVWTIMEEFELFYLTDLEFSSQIVVDIDINDTGAAVTIISRAVWESKFSKTQLQ